MSRLTSYAAFAGNLSINTAAVDQSKQPVISIKNDRKGLMLNLDPQDYKLELKPDSKSKKLNLEIQKIHSEAKIIVRSDAPVEFVHPDALPKFAPKAFQTMFGPEFTLGKE